MFLKYNFRKMYVLVFFACSAMQLLYPDDSVLKDEADLFVQRYNEYGEERALLEDNFIDLTTEIVSYKQAEKKQHASILKNSCVRHCDGTSCKIHTQCCTSHCCGKRNPRRSSFLSDMGKFLAVVCFACMVYKTRNIIKVTVLSTAWVISTLNYYLGKVPCEKILGYSTE